MRSVCTASSNLIRRANPRSLSSVRTQRWNFSPPSAGVQSVAEQAQQTVIISPPVPESRSSIPVISEEPPPPIVSELLNTEPITVAQDTERWPMMVPEFWTGQAPLPESDYLIDCSEYNLYGSLDTIPEELIEKMHAVYNKTGLLLLRNTGLTEVGAMKKLVDIIVNQTMTYEGGANSRRGVEQAAAAPVKNVYDTGAPYIAHLHYHHEMAYVGESVRQVAFMCTKAPKNGNGASYVSDGVKSTDAILATPFGQKLKNLGICYVRCLTDRDQYTNLEKGWNGMDEVGVYNHWQQSFGVETAEEVEKLAARRGLQVEWGPNRYCKTKYYVSAFEYCADLDRNLLYSSLADDSIWFDTWPGVAQLPTMPNYESANANERPLKLLFGDDSEMTREELQLFIDVYDRFGMPITWDTVGDMVVMCNWRWAHGRPSFQLDHDEDREIGVVLGPMFKRSGHVDGKW